jgi:choline transport protein
MHTMIAFAIQQWALLANAAAIFAIGCVYLGSTTAFDAIIGCGLVLQHITYAVPAGLLALHHRRSADVLPRKRSFALPNVVGYFANAVTVAMAVLELMFYNFPNCWSD